MTKKIQIPAYPLIRSKNADFGPASIAFGSIGWKPSIWTPIRPGSIKPGKLWRLTASGTHNVESGNVGCIFGTYDSTDTLINTLGESIGVAVVNTANDAWYVQAHLGCRIVNEDGGLVGSEYSILTGGGFFSFNGSVGALEALDTLNFDPKDIAGIGLKLTADAEGSFHYKTNFAFLEELN